MMEQHYIQWIALETKEGVQIKHLTPEMKPVAEFALSANDEAVAAYEFSNLRPLEERDLI